MDNTNKVDFVKSLCDSIKLEIISKIESGKIPDNWDGIELRQLLSEKFQRETYKMDRKRKKDYANSIVCNNI